MWPTPPENSHQYAAFDLPGGESTSARLRQVQADLAASQADLTKAERERDEAVRRAADLEQVREELKQLRLLADGYLEDIRQLESGRDEQVEALRSRLIETGGERDRAVEALRVAERSHAIRVWALEAELASARQELAQLRAAHCPDPANRG